MAAALVMALGACGAGSDDAGAPPAPRPASPAKATAAPRLSTGQTCGQLRTVLAQTGLGWPIAQQPAALSRQRLDRVRTGFAEVARRSAPPLSTQLLSWSLTLTKAIPYLLDDDEAGLMTRLTQQEQNRFFDDNITITNTCHW